MKKILFTITLFSVCSLLNAQTIEKQAVKEYLETVKGVKYDLKVAFTHFEISTITVQDSIAILKDSFEKNKTQKLASLTKSIASLNDGIKKQEGKTGLDAVVAGSLKKRFTYDRDKLQKKYDEIVLWKFKLYEPYKTESPEKILSKKADVHFTAIKPGETKSSAYTGDFVLNPKGDKCLKSKNIKKIEMNF
ncbi:hypothetical protein [Wenyingzhuangia aestuarii]|uniref:hypothetical protein n=1 Tax=Wenyingzhuangia aestuarii TaxID=1647582 RepID=UPI001438C2B2|nr:hypothetical protein [Wenyingzhuangia aestuarii]NJB82066.1 hypothetical protein [Wenyingzhuangia aestuarii]